MATAKQKTTTNLSKVIATIDVNLTAVGETVTEVEPTPRERFLDEYSHCPLCGTDLLFTHVANFAQNVAHEEAHCEACKIRTKSLDHMMQ